MLTQLRDPEDTLTLDSQAVVRWCQTPPHRECADRDLREFIYSTAQGNPIPMRWIPGHRELVQACSRQEREDIWCNNEVTGGLRKRPAYRFRTLTPLASVTLSSGEATHLSQRGNGFWRAELSLGSAEHIG